MGTLYLSTVDQRGTMNVHCTWRLNLLLLNGDTNLQEAGDAIMDALLTREVSDPRLHDSAVALNLSTQELEVSVMCECESMDAGIQHAMTAITSAIHTAGGATSEWPLHADGGSTHGWSVHHEELVVS